MPGLSLAPVNFAAQAEQNPLAQIGQALSAFPQEQTAAQLQNQQVGQQMLAPYFKMLRSDYSLRDNPRFMGTISQIAHRYNIPIPDVQQEMQQAESGSAPEQPSAATPQAPTAPGAPAPSPAKPTGPQTAMSIGGPPPQTPAVSAPAIGPMTPGAGTVPSEASFQQQLPQHTVQPTAPSGAPIPGAPGVPTGQAQAPRPTSGSSVDPWSTFIGANLDPATVLTLQQMQPEQRAAFLQSTGIDPKWVPKSLLTSPVVMDPTQKVKVLDAINQDMTKLMNSGNLTAGAVQSMVGSYEAAGLIDKATANSWINNQTNLTQLGQGEKVKLDTLRQAGVLKEQNYNLAVQRLNAYMTGQSSIEDYRKFEEQFIGFKENYMTVQQSQNQQRISLENQRMMNDVGHWDALLAQGDERLSHSDYATLAQDARSAEGNYNSLMATYAQLPSGTDITAKTGPNGESFADTLASAKALKESLEKQLKQANQGYRNPTPALQKQGIQTPGGRGNTVNIQGKAYHVGDMLTGQGADGQTHTYKVLPNGKLQQQP